MSKTPQSPARRAHRRVLHFAAVAALGLGLLAGCGGSTSTVDAFIPGRLLVFGDDLSTMTSDGRKYTVNAADENGLLQCQLNPLWVQTLAAQYAMVFAECNPDNQGNPKAKMLAAAGATTEDMATQIRTFTSSDSIQPDDLATVLVGMNDVLQAYATWPSESEDVLIALMEDAGARAAQQVNELAGSGARVLVSTMPDLGQSPFAKAEALEKGDVAAAVLSRMSTAFNRSLRLNLLNDGSKLGLLLMDDLMHGMVRVSAGYGLSNIDTPVCEDSAPLPDCNSLTLVSGDPTPTASNYLWADATRPSPVPQHYLGIQAITRARNNPF
ncbi:SGNH/GDSL hydrolase family protein [Ideonella sp. YS5]|uniref:SGNH/GDSL hydrolase family protein n=1 Tax=Ideonella sp. YS5 TaxID=3453714 RepID=UPI003EEF775C